MSQILYAETSGQLETASGGWTSIPGLQFTLPAASPSETTSLITLCLPNPYASGTDFPGGTIGISVNDAVLVPVGCFTAESKTPQSFGRKPVTLVVQVALLNANTQVVRGVWQSVRNSTVIIDTPSTLSAIIS
jgi:mannose-binding lectin